MKPLVSAAGSLALLLFSAFTWSAEVPFNQREFDAAKAAGKPVAVVFHADWCPTCRAQAPVLKELAQTADLKPLTLFVANFDTEQLLRKSLRVTQQSTVVVFRNGKEIARSTGDTQKDALAALLHQAVS
jgi:thiol-disulfide isomerase/thioredoxin